MFKGSNVHRHYTALHLVYNPNDTPPLLHSFVIEWAWRHEGMKSWAVLATATYRCGRLESALFPRGRTNVYHGFSCCRQTKCCLAQSTNPHWSVGWKGFWVVFFFWSDFRLQVARCSKHAERKGVNSWGVRNNILIHWNTPYVASLTPTSTTQRSSLASGMHGMDLTTEIVPSSSTSVVVTLSRKVWRERHKINRMWEVIKTVFNISNTIKHVTEKMYLIRCSERTVREDLK